MANLSVFVLTYNEEANIERCLESLKDFSDDIFIIDSFSTDRTLEICERFGCKILQNPFVNHALQSNWAIDNAPFKYEWVLRLDSDELLPRKLKGELSELVMHLGEDVCGIYLNRRQYFMNRWLKHGGIYPHYILRVFRRDAGLYENKTEEHFVLKRGTAVRARNDFLEDNRNNDLDFWLGKHQQLARGEVLDTLGDTYLTEEDIKPHLFGEKVQRTRWLKRNVYQNAPLFVRAFLYFIYRYVFRLGFLDGTPGFIYFVNQSFWYRFFVDSRIYEIKSRWQDVELDFTDV